MDDSQVTSGFKGLSALVYLLNALCSILFLFSGPYLSVIIGLYNIAMCFAVLISVLQQPASLNEKLGTHAEFLYTFKGRFIVDVAVSLFLFGMHAFGTAMAIITMVLIIGIRLTSNSFPGAFEEIFKPSGDASSDFDSPYRGMPSKSNFSPQPSADL